MSRLALVAILMLAVAGPGCAIGRRTASTGFADGRNSAPADDTQAVPASAVTSALVFRAPVALNNPPLDLARGPRQPSAFVGFEEPITEYYHVLTIDRQVSGYGSPWSVGTGRGWAGGYGDRYEREAVTEKVGVLHR